MAKKLTKLERQKLLTQRIKDEPFLTDEELAKAFAVSIQTIRLDRLELGIPELRERTKQVAQKAYASVRAMQGQEIIGDLIDLNLGVSGITVLETENNMAFTRTKIIRGHYIFAQANSLAVALIDAPVALTATANIKFKSSARVGDRLIAKAVVTARHGDRYQINVVTKVGERIIFEGDFVVVAVDTN